MDQDQLPPPTVFGLPSKFGKWRPHQAEAMESQTEDKPALPDLARV
jgi:hypothetical protein